MPARVGRNRFSRCDGGAFIQQPRRKVAPAGGNNIADGRAHQAGNSRGGGDKNPFFPHLLEDRIAELRHELRPGELGLDRACFVALRRIARTVGQPMGVIQMEDAAFGIQRGGDQAQAAEYRWRAEFAGRDAPDGACR